jgi:DNA-binding MarR family transcriptional regulator
MAPNPDQVRDLRNESIGRVFLRLYRDFQVRCIPKLESRGHSGLSDAHINVLVHLDRQGTRIVKLAERANMTKQSMGDLIQELEQKGYVTRTPDPNDKRATIIHFSQLGQQFLLDAYAVKLEMEAEYATILGQAEMEQFMIFARKLLEHAAHDPIL